MKNFIYKNKWTVTLLIIILIFTMMNIEYGKSIMEISWSNTKTMLGIIPPIFILIGLLDVWVPKETMIKYMGEKSGVTGLFFAFILGSMAAGPLYAAFPVAAILLKKGARIAYVIFFLSTWTVAKIPLLLFEITSFGMTFTMIHVITMMSIFFVGSFIIEKQLNKIDKEAIIERVTTLSNS